MTARVWIAGDPLTFKVSKPGIDVLTGADDDMLMAMGLPPLMVIAAGRVALTSGVAQDVFWPKTLPSTPIVDIQRSLSGAATSNIVPFRSTSGGYTRVQWVVSTTKVTFTASGGDTTVTYVAVTRSQL